MKYVANIISISRILILTTLFFTFRYQYLFVSLYLLCGLTDLLDGYIARKTHTESRLGAQLDSIADLLLFGVITVVLIRWLGDEIYDFLPWLIAIFIIRCGNMAIVAYKHRTFGIIHTWGNKLTGLMLFITPLLIAFNREWSLLPTCIIGFISSLEETLILLTATGLDLNRKSLLTKNNE